MAREQALEQLGGLEESLFKRELREEGVRETQMAPMIEGHRLPRDDASSEFSEPTV